MRTTEAPGTKGLRMLGPAASRGLLGGGFPCAAGHRSSSGFTLLELLISILILAIVLTFVAIAASGMKKTTEIERARVEVGQEARFILDEITSLLREAGSGKRYEQTPIIYASPYEVAFNADIDHDLETASEREYALDGGYCFPGYAEDIDNGGSTDDCSADCAKPWLNYYCDSGEPTLRFRTQYAYGGLAETLRITIDSSSVAMSENTGKFIIDSDDASNDGNAEAAFSINPSDYTLILTRSGCPVVNDLDSAACDNRQNAAYTRPLGKIRAYTAAADTYPNGELPQPLFQYWISEEALYYRLIEAGIAEAAAKEMADIAGGSSSCTAGTEPDYSGDGDIADELLFGDDGAGTLANANDGVLNQDEIAALLVADTRGSIGIPVGQRNADCRLGDLFADAGFNPMWLAGAVSRVTVTVTAESPVEAVDYNNPLRASSSIDYRYLHAQLVSEVKIRLLGVYVPTAEPTTTETAVPPPAPELRVQPTPTPPRSNI
ncbi:MAG: prepilin-type N-terminal cleavage/methylation domain-containing protein [Candidatus Schekmanbacteria bacterium]|nr:prepilin-type N-terminal cleavage/methylation domain-containing protein [Candidatus Schekmanbacteria bacterium]